jgi:hypothetical protein
MKKSFKILSLHNGKLDSIKSEKIAWWIFLFVFIFITLGLNAQHSVTKRISPDHNWTILYRSNQLPSADYTLTFDNQVGKCWNSTDDIFYHYRKALRFDLSDIPSDAKINSCDIHYHSGDICTYGAQCGTLVFTSMDATFTAHTAGEYDDVWSEIYAGNQINSEYIYNFSGYDLNTNLNSWVNDIQDSIQSSSRAIALGIYNNGSSSNQGTSFSYPLLDIIYIDSTPPAPTNFNYNSPTSTGFNLTWSASTGVVTGYDIYIDSVYYNSTSTTSIAITGLLPQTQYNVYVVPYNSHGVGVVSTHISPVTSSWIINGPSLLCVSGSSFTLENIPNIIHNWHTSTNLEIVGSSTSYSVYISPKIGLAGSSWICDSISTADYEHSWVVIRQLTSLIDGSIIGDEISTLDFEGEWSIQINQSCFTNFSFEWYLEPSELPICTNSVFQNTFDDEYFSPGYIELYCKIINGQYYVYTPHFEVQLIAHEPLTADPIYGDEYVCLDGYGFWGTYVNGGVGDYTYEWSINNQIVGYGYDLLYFFSYPEWTTYYGKELKFRVYDSETYAETEPFFFNLDWCSSMRDSIILYPNPANDYIKVSVLDSKFLFENTKNSVTDRFKGDVEIFYTYIFMDNNGKILYQIKTKEKNIQISTSSYLSGIYRLKIISPFGITDKQVIITH